MYFTSLDKHLCTLTACVRSAGAAPSRVEHNAYQCLGFDRKAEFTHEIRPWGHRIVLNAAVTVGSCPATSPSGPLRRDKHWWAGAPNWHFMLVCCAIFGLFSREYCPPPSRAHALSPPPFAGHRWRWRGGLNWERGETGRWRRLSGFSQALP